MWVTFQVVAAFRSDAGSQRLGDDVTASSRPTTACFLPSLIALLPKEAYPSDGV
jgi:hypothetical protein